MVGVHRTVTKVVLKRAQLAEVEKKIAYRTVTKVVLKHE